MNHRTTIAAALCAAVLAAAPVAAGDAPFGGEADTAFAADLWSAIDGYTAWRMQSDVYPGQSPHGKFLRMYANVVTVGDRAYDVIIKDNFGGPSAEAVAAAPTDHLKAVTVMVRREDGYDPGHDDWFWVKYAPDGTVAENPQGMALAGRVAKGTDKGCIACHGKAGGGDYIFSND